MASDLTDRAERTERRFRMPYDDYFRMVEDTTHSEWVDGEVAIFAPPSTRHQLLHAFFLSILTMVISANRRGIALSAPFEMKLRSGHSYREPDILVILSENEHGLDGQRLNGPADIAMEILSPESVARDRQEKFREYEQEGLHEYWIVDGRYEAIAPDSQRRIHSRILPGFWVDIAWLTADELPNEFDVVQELLAERFRA
jgi:Uma2 family endonuclease